MLSQLGSPAAGGALAMAVRYNKSIEQTSLRMLFAKCHHIDPRRPSLLHAVWRAGAVALQPPLPPHQR